MKLRSAALTDIGKVRLQNQDQYLCQPALGLFGVADGVGGLPGGAEAAECAVRTLIHRFKADGEAKPDLTAAMLAANQAVERLGELVSPGMGIGTTVVFGLFRAGHLSLAHVGDSRAYVLHDGSITQLTQDHTVENETKRKGTPDDYLLLHPSSRHTLTRCVGQPVPLEVDTVERPLTSGECYLFLTDGITRLVSDEELVGLAGQKLPPADFLRKMIDLALDRGGNDNATAVAVFVDDATP